MDTKRCSRCGEVKPVKEFNRDRNRKDGFYIHCKKCATEVRGRVYKQPEYLPEGYKRCTKCSEMKPLSDFNRRQHSKDGYHPRCKKCVTEARGRVYKLPDHLSDGYRRCSKCKELYPANNEFFYIHDPISNKLRADCRKCFLKDCQQRQKKNNEQVNEKNRRWRAANQEKVRESGRKSARRWREANRDHAIEKSRKWHRENKDKTKAYEQEYARTHREQRRETRRLYRINNHESIREHRRVGKQRRRTRKLGLPNTFKTPDWRIALNYWNNKCAICGREEGNGWTLAPDHWIPLSYEGADNPGTVPTNIVPLCHGIGGCNNEKFNHYPVEFLISKLGEEAADQKLFEIETYFEFVKSLQGKE